MASATVKWIGGEQFVGTDSTAHSVVLSTRAEGVGMSPAEQLLIALASCTAVSVVQILAKRRMPLSFMEIHCAGQQDETPPWTFRKIHLHYVMRGDGLTAEAAERAIWLAEEKYCTVAATLRATVEITYDVEII